MSRIEQKALESVARGVGFSTLAITCVGAGLSFDPTLAAKSIAILCTLLAIVLMALGERARYRSVKRTETWILLERHERPPPEVAQKVVGEAIRKAMLHFARMTSAASIAFWTVTLVLELTLTQP